MGEPRTYDEIETSCNPITNNTDLDVLVSANGTPLEPDAVANPCGLVAKSYFNDSYTFFDTDPSGLSDAGLKAANITIDDTNIAWKSDAENKFKNCEGCTFKDGTPAPTWEYVQWTSVTDPHFIVWMRTAGLPNFRKLWGQIDEKLSAGTYFV